MQGGRDTLIVGVLAVGVAAAMLAIVLFGWVSLLYPVLSPRSRGALIRIGSLCALCYLAVLATMVVIETSRVVTVFVPLR